MASDDPRRTIPPSLSHSIGVTLKAMLLSFSHGDCHDPRRSLFAESSSRMGEVTHTTVLNKISDDEERKIAIM